MSSVRGIKKGYMKHISIDKKVPISADPISIHEFSKARACICLLRNRLSVIMETMDLVHI
jgi:hypothetical protein